MKKLLFVLTVSMIALTSCNKKMNISGTYETDFGDLQLQEKDKKVTGTYSYPGASGVEAKGTLTGDLKETVLTFSWEQVQGDTKSGGTGSFTFADQGKSFTGTWQDSMGKTGPWNGKKK